MKLLNIFSQKDVGLSAIGHSYNLRIYLNGGMIDLWMFMKEYTLNNRGKSMGRGGI